MSEQVPGRPRWRQVNLWCDDWQTVEQTAVTHLGPLLTEAEDNGSITSWWFVRKSESWRLRFLPRDDRDETSDTLARLTALMADHGAIRRYAEVVYEPETHAFGGDAATAVAHDLFHADSRHLLAHLAIARTGADRRRELGLLLGTRLMGAARQDWYEQGDVWVKLAAHTAAANHPQPSRATLAAVQRLLTASGDTSDSPLASAPGWQAAFEHAGAALADLHQRGELTRGLRAVLAHHLLFAFNRLGVAAQDRHALATAASQIVFHQNNMPGTAPTASVHRHQPVPDSTGATGATGTLDPERQKETLIAFIDGLGTFRTPQVVNAFRAVPRHRFLPGVDLATAYAPKPVVTKRADDGTAVSSASSPNVVATMLEQLAVAPGHRVLEIGAATGINAALLAELTGPTGTVVTVELDDDLASGARANLTATGYRHVEVVCGDGALGHPAGAPYDRIVVTAGAWDIPTPWWRQLATGSRLVVPLRLHGSGLTRSIAFDLEEPDRMVSASVAVCGFVPMRGAGEMGERYVPLADDAVLKIDAEDLPDEAALADALTVPSHVYWTGVQVRHDEPAQHLDLWLATTSGVCFGRLSVGSSARALRMNPAVRWGGATLYDGGTIAYLAVRPLTDKADELGVVAYGHESSKLAVQVSDLLHRWSQERPAQPGITARPTGSPGNPLLTGSRIARPDTSLTIIW